MNESKVSMNWIKAIFTIATVGGILISPLRALEVDRDVSPRITLGGRVIATPTTEFKQGTGSKKMRLSMKSILRIQDCWCDSINISIRGSRRGYHWIHSTEFRIRSSRYGIFPSIQCLLLQSKFSVEPRSNPTTKHPY